MTAALAMLTAPESIVRDFIRRINDHDPEGVVRLCTPLHVFTDSLGNRLTGRAALLPAWRGYFSLFPNYRVRVSALFARGHDRGSSARPAARSSTFPRWPRKDAAVPRAAACEA
jgi:hypothetical protein